MKNSKIPWIGDIPNHWTLCSTSALFHEHKEKNKGLTCTNLLSLSYGRIRRKDINTTEGLLPESFDTYNIISSGDIVFRLTDLQNDHKSLRTALCTEQGIITSAYLTLRKNACINERYYHYLFHIYDVCKVFYGMGDGVRQGMGWNDIKSMPLFMAPYEEQQRIADFLDHKCTDIDNVLEKTKTGIEEYKKLKQSIINEAVTKGIRGLRPMKDCGIEWASSIPSEWEVKRVKRCINSYSKGNGITKDEVFVDGNTPCVRYGEIYSRYDNSFSECVSATKIEIQQSPQYVSKDDILCAATGELIEEIGKATAYVGNTPCLAGGDIIILRHNQNPVFLSYVLNSRYAQAQKSCTKTKLKVVHISASDICNVLIALPPLEEQHEIASYLDHKCSEIDSLIASKEMFIAELELYKKSLIYEYVTGKKEVPSNA